MFTKKIWLLFIILLLPVTGCDLLEGPAEVEDPPAAQMLPNLSGYKTVEGGGTRHGARCRDSTA